MPSAFADSAAAHALMHRLDHHGHTLRFEDALQFGRNLISQTFLHLEPARVYTSVKRASFERPTIFLFGR